MPDNNRWLLPEGVDEILPPKAIRLERLCRNIIDLFSSWGYEFVIPPMIEYLESLLTGTGEDLDLQTFKLTDQLNGRLMGIRADITPQVARIDARLLKSEAPARLCYLGSVLHTRPGKPGDTRAPLQSGAELYGYNGVAGDIEIVKLMLATLKLAGVEEICIDLGHIGIFRSLSTASLNDNQRFQVFEVLQRKARDELKTLCNDWNITDKQRSNLLELVELHGDTQVLEQAKKCFKSSPEIIRFINELEMLVDAVTDQQDLKINIDLAELRGYHYHTGMVYTAFVPGAGEGIAFGGRYDDIGLAFGRARPATGFSVDVKSLIKFQDLDTGSFPKIFAPLTGAAGLQEKIAALRASGQVVIQELEQQQARAREMGCDRQLVFENRAWVVKKI